jgi:hypothetical protein
VIVMADFEIVIVNGVRYRPEDAPKKTEAKKSEPQNKARKAVSNKTASPSNEDDKK